jgi:hypothetical protein
MLASRVTVCHTAGMDDPRLAAFGLFTPEGYLTPGYGDHYLFMVGRDDVHGILLALLTHETMGLKFNMFGYDDETLNAAILTLMANPNVAVQASLDRSQAGGVHERAILASNLKDDPDFYNSFVILQSATHQISHTKGGVLIAQGLAFEGSTNWSASGEGTGIKLDPLAKPAPGYVAQNNTLMLSANPVFNARFAARLDVEHAIGLQQQIARDAKAAAEATAGGAP